MTTLLLFFSKLAVVGLVLPVHMLALLRMHNKFCILNKASIWTGSTNPTTASFEKNNNNVVIVPSKYLAENYEAEFEELYKGTFGKGNKVKYPIIKYNNKIIENYFCPEDDCGTEVVEELKAAKQEILAMTFSFTDRAIVNTLLEKAKNNVKINVLFEKRRQNMDYAYTALQNKENIQLIPDTNPGIMHHKVFIIDEKTVVTGSMNPTQNGNERNDENILILHDEDIA